MGKWKWEGFTKEGKKIKGEQEAKDERELRKALRGQGVRPTRVHPPSILEIDLAAVLAEKGFTKPFGQKELTGFTRQLAIMINSGVPILQALEILFKQEKNGTLKAAVKKIAEDVGSGSSLSDAMAKHKGFDKLYCNLVKAGEVGGILDKILDKLSKFMERQEKVKSQVKGALTYPGIVTIVGGGVIYVMLVFVVPKFTSILEESGQEIPQITQIVVYASDFLRDYTIYMIPGLIVSLMLFLRWKKSKDGKPLWDKFVMKVPLFGDLIIKGNLSSFTRTLSTMLSAGVALIDSLDICGETIDNSVIAKDIALVRQQITEGKTLAEPLSHIKYFPVMVSQMIKVGEATGNMDDMLEKVADLFEEEVNNIISVLSKLIEPFILVFLGGIVAVVLVAMYLPIFLSAGAQSD